MHRLLRVLLICFVFLLPVACENQPKKSGAIDVQFLASDGTALSPMLSVELALTLEQQRVGLMYRNEMPEKEGMLFIFPEEKARAFWMKNTYIPLDIIYLNKDLKVVSIIENAIPRSTTARPSVLPAKFVVEVNGGLSKAWGLTPGATLKAPELPESP